MQIVKIPKVGDELGYYIYALFAESPRGEGFVKFGRSANLTKRFNDLKTASPLPLKMIALTNVGSEWRGIDTERALHDHFAARRTNGEWFEFDFRDPKAKKDFNSGCKDVFKRLLGNAEAYWWTKISVEALEKYRDEQRRESIDHATAYRKNAVALRRRAKAQNA